MLITKFKHEYIGLILEFLIFTLFIKLILIGLNIKSNHISENVFLYDLLNNWSAYPIKELYIAEKCDNDKNLFTRQWEGIEPNCDCRLRNINITSTIIPGKCSMFDLMTNCVETKELPPTTVTNWKGKNICIKEYDYGYLNTITIIGSQCPQGYQVCGKDSKGFNICFPDKIECPINKIRITNKPVNGFNGTRLGDNWYLNTSRNFTNETIPVEFKYTEGRVCLYPNEQNLKMNYNIFKKVNETISNGPKSKYFDKTHPYCKSKLEGRFNFDDRYIVLDNNSKYMFFSNNGILSKIQDLPFVDTKALMGYNSIINYRPYIHWNPYCKGEFDRFVVVNDLLKLDMFCNFYLIFVNALIFAFVFYLFLPLLNFISKIDASLLISMVLSLLIANGTLQFYFSKDVNIADKLIIQKCGDYVTDVVFEDIAKKFYRIILDSYKIELILVIILALLIIKRILK
jgi:hypothetical protein